jgi:lipopolysaccharide transport system permease protein
MFRDLWNHRSLLKTLVQREFQLRSTRAVWGTLWLVLQPAVQIFIFTAVFAQVLRAKLPGSDDPLAYGLFVCSGLITWGFFAELVTRGQTLFLDHAHLLKAMRFPRSLLPISLVAIGAINFALIAGVFLIALGITGRWPGTPLLAALPLLGVQSLLGIALGILVGTLQVFFRDIGYAVGVAFQFWFWLTPIVYPIAIVPERFRGLVDWNPMLPVIQGYQRVVLERAWPLWSELWVPAALALALGLFSWAVFRRLSPDLVDEL